MSKIHSYQVRTPPHNTEIEAAIIGTMLLAPKVVPTIMSMLRADDFFEERHRLIFQAIRAIFQSGRTADVRLITEHMQRENILSKIGGAVFLAELVNCIPATPQVESYTKIIKQKSKLRRIIDIATDVTNACFSEEEPDEILNRFGRDFFETAAGGAGGARNINETLPEVFEQIELRRMGKVDTGLKTGFIDLDKLTTGLQPSDLIILAARPSMGKTALAMQIAENVARNGKGVLVFSLEMSATQLQERLLAMMSAVNLGDIRSGKVSDNDWKTLKVERENLQAQPITIDDRAGLSISQLRASAKMVHMRTPINLIVVDYLQLLRGAGDTRTLEVADISRGLKMMAKELNVPVLALSQLNRALESREDKKPKLSDLRESGSIEQDADLICFIYRDEVYFGNKSTATGIANILVKKHRNGALGDVELRFDGSTVSFRNSTYKKEKS